MDNTEMRDIIKGSSQIAQIVVNYYFELKQCGMEDEDALTLAVAYQSSIISNSRNSDD